MKKVLGLISMSAMLLTPSLASANVYDWTFAASGISGSGTLTASVYSGSEYLITGGTGTVTDSTYGSFAVTFQPCATPAATCTAVNTDGIGTNLTYDDLVTPGNAIGSQLDSNGILLVPGPPGSGSSAIGIWDSPSQSFYSYSSSSPNGYVDLSTPFNVTPAATPEPGFYGLTALGLSGLAVALKRRRA